MIKLQCKIDGQRIIALDSCGISKIKNGDTIDIKNEDLIQPEIQFLISKDILTVIEEVQNPLIMEEKRSYISPTVVVFECNVPDGRKLTLDSIKGTVETGHRIEIKAADLNNEDVVYAINKNFITPVDKPAVQDTVKQDVVTQAAEDVVEEPTIEESISVVEAFVLAEKEDEEIIEGAEDVALEELSETDEKEEAPKFRVSEDVESGLKNLADSVYANNEKSKEARKPAKPGTRKKRQSKRKSE